MDGSFDPPCSRTGRMSLTQQLRFVTLNVEEEGELEVHEPVIGTMEVGVTKL